MSLLEPAEIQITYQDGSVKHFALKFGDSLKVREINTHLGGGNNPIYYLTAEIVPHHD